MRRPSIRPKSFRNRLFLVLAVVALVPSALVLVSGTLVLREAVVTTGTAGAWDAVARSGRELQEEVRALDDPSPGLVAATDRHVEELSQSVQFSRLYAFLGERVLSLLPWFSVGLLLLAATLAFLAAQRFSRNFSRPLEELAGWTRSLGAGQPLPPPDPDRERGEVREFRKLRDAMRQSSEELGRAREREVEGVRTRAWSEMARKVAHELKNPLTPMRMAAERVADARDPEVARAGEVLREEIGRLDSLARAFAHFGRPPDGPMSPIDLAELLSTLSDRLSTEDAPIVFRPPEQPVEVTGHLEAIERVVRNLLANAQESLRTHADRNGVAPVEVALLSGESDAEIRILDRGSGIPDDALARIWEPDFTTKGSGTGLGLAMVQQAVRAHGGEVTAANRAEGGAEFRVRLPYRPPHPPGVDGASGIGGSSLRGGSR